MTHNYTPSTRQNVVQGKAPYESYGSGPVSTHTNAAARAKEVQETREHLQESWVKTQERVKHYYDKHHKEVIFAEGDWVILSSKYIKLRKAIKKLLDKFLRPFQVMKRIGQNAYQL